MEIKELNEKQLVNILTEIHEILSNHNLTDFYVVEEIVLLFEKYNLDIGARHDF